MIAYLFMNWRNYIIAGLFLFAFNSSMSQDYLGSWTLDWSQVIDTSEYKNPAILFGLEELEGMSGQSIVWILGEHSIKILKGGKVISEAEIEWVSNHEFVILDPKRSGMPKHYLDYVDNGRVLMRSNYGDGVIYLKKL